MGCASSSSAEEAKTVQDKPPPPAPGKSASPATAPSSQVRSVEGPKPLGIHTQHTTLNALRRRKQKPAQFAREGEQFPPTCACVHLAGLCLCQCVVVCTSLVLTCRSDAQAKPDTAPLPTTAIAISVEPKVYAPLLKQCFSRSHLTVVVRHAGRDKTGLNLVDKPTQACDRQQ